MPTERHRRYLYRRRFLNRRGHHAGAYLLAEITLGRLGDNDSHVDASLTLADCSRIVTLDFDAYSHREGENALHKARLLRDLFIDYVDALERACADRELPAGRADD